MSDIKDGSAVFTVRDKRAQALFDFVYPVGIVVALANDKSRRSWSTERGRRWPKTECCKAPVTEMLREKD